jgi:hypothetical protein
MPAYRCYFIHARKVASVEIVETEADDDAVQRAVALLQAKNADRVRYTGIELWELARLVHVHPGEPPELPMPDQGRPDPVLQP